MKTGKCKRASAIRSPKRILLAYSTAMTCWGAMGEHDGLEDVVADYNVLYDMLIADKFENTRE